MASTLDNDPAEDREIWSVCNQLKYLSTGERASLRRMYLTRSAEADGVVEKLIRRAGVFLEPDDDASFEMWRLVTHAAAIVAGTTAQMAHAGKRPFGRALSIAGMKSAAVNRLLTARGPALQDQIRRIAYLLSRHLDAVPTNMTELHDLASPRAEVASKAKRSIARAYFAAEDKRDREKAK